MTIDRKILESLAASGHTRGEIAKLAGCSVSAVDLWTKSSGTKLVRQAMPNAAPSGRTEKMVSMYRQGLTLEKIGQHFKLTRERVRQVLKVAGISAIDGGKSIVSNARKEARQNRLEAKCLAKWGYPRAMMAQLREDGVLRAFTQQRQSASNRGIDWHLTFADWFSIWQVSGKLHLRGRGRGHYVMSRICDDGPYSLGNVHVQLCEENSRDAVEKWRGKVKANRGVYCLYPGRELAWHARVADHKLGFFKTEQEAVDARDAFLAANPDLRGAGNHKGYYERRGVNKTTYQVMVGKRYVGVFATADLALAARAAYIASQEQVSA